MPTTPEQCANYALNIQMCPCTAEQCPNRGLCCECLQAHAAKNSATSCMRGALRNPETLALSAEAAAKCPTNQERNAKLCTCTYDPCDNRGVCCNCVRNHFTTDGTGRVACMRGF
ncbi:MAG: hypothetical protein WCP21_00590 [Armatimonadota bacterium]